MQQAIQYEAKRQVEILEDGKKIDQETYDKIKETFPDNERRLLPNSFNDLLISYFDDMFVYADNYRQAIIALKIVLEAARLAGIKFSARN